MDSGGKMAGIFWFQGMVFILAGLVWGLVVPNTPYPRLALTAHIQFESSGVLFPRLIAGLALLTLPHRGMGRKSLLVITAAVWLTWLMALRCLEVGNALVGNDADVADRGQAGGGVGRRRVAGIDCQAGSHRCRGWAWIVAWTPAHCRGVCEEAGRGGQRWIEWKPINATRDRSNCERIEPVFAT